MRRAGFRLALVFTIVFFAAATVRAQWNTPTIDGYIAPGEYGSNNSLSNAGNTGQTWYMTWDATNLYVGIVNANLGEAAACAGECRPRTAGGFDHHEPFRQRKWLDQLESGYRKSERHGFRQRGPTTPLLDQRRSGNGSCREQCLD